MPSLFEKEGWLNAVAQLRAKAAEFERLMGVVKSTYSTAANSPELYKEYETLLFKGNVIKGTIQTLTSGIDYIFRIFDTVFGDTEPEQLGIIPLVPIAVILSAVGAITYWINDSLKYLNKVNEIRRIESQGYSAKEAYKIVHGDKKGFFEKMLEPKFLLIGGGLIVFLILSKRRRI
ncbi:MAG: hypothetical protein ABW166_04945 [Sedimenticola sp.]